MRLVTSFCLFLPLVPPGHLKANQTLEGAGGSITSVDFDPSVRGPGWHGMPLPESPHRAGGALGEHHGYPRAMCPERVPG